MEKSESIDHALRATWQTVAKMYNEQASKHNVTMAVAMALLNIDYKNGKYVYHHLKDRFKKDGYQKIVARNCNTKHQNYLKKLGFQESDNCTFIKEL